MTSTVAIGGLGAIGLKLARALDEGVEGLRLIAASARWISSPNSTFRRAVRQGNRCSSWNTIPRSGPGAVTACSTPF